MKEIKDYLHLYLGVRHRYKWADSGNWTVWTELTANRLSRLDDYSISEIQLELRPLSSMTSEEKREFSNLAGFEKLDLLFWADVRKAAPVITYLLSKHFDLFGLIESGLAIDKTTH